MSFRGTIKNGVVVLEGPANLPEGQQVDVTPVLTSDAQLPGFGLWRDRQEITDAAAESLRVRREVERGK